MKTDLSDFEAFFTDHYATVCRALYLALGNEDDAEEAAQEAFARAFRRWDDVAGAERPGTWVFVVAVREARRVQRRRRRPLEPRLRVVAPDPGDRVASRMLLDDALRGLSARQRMALTLRYYADLSTRDIAAAMRCREGTVKATIHAALHHLRAVHAEDPLEECHG